jgi:hypothetical protein
MRFARTALGLLLTVAGLVVTVAGALAAFWLVGPDNTISAPGRALSSSGLAVVTAPNLLDRHGPTLHVTATGDKPLFVGVGQDIDVRDYLSSAAHTRLIRFEPPATFGLQEMRGSTDKLVAPGKLDWWVARTGSGESTLAWPIQDGRYDVVVMNADGSPAVGAQVRFGIEVHRSFGLSLVGLGAGILILAFGLMLTFRRRPAESAIVSVPVRIPGARINTDEPAYSTPVQPEPAPVAARATPVVEPVSPYAPERVSPFAPKPATVPAAPVFMSAAAVARAKSPRLVGVGTLQANRTHDDRTYAEAIQEDRPEPGTEPETVSLVESPEFQKSDEAVRKTAALLASGAMLLTTTSCGLLPAKNTAEASESRPAVTLADAQAVIQRYNDLNNKANQTRDAKLSSTIEADPTLAQTRAGFLIGAKLDSTGKDKDKPFTYTDPKVGAPVFASYPMRFVVDSGISGAPDSRQLGVWERQSAATPWLLTHSVYPSKTVQIPKLDGLRSLGNSDVKKLASPPTEAGRDLAAYLTGGAKAPQSKLFVPSPGTTKLLELRAKSALTDTAEPYIASVTDTFALSGEPLTFITANGEALVFLSLTEQYLQRVEPGSNAYWTSGEATAFSGSTVKYTQTLHQDYLHQVALVIPTKAAGTPIRILSMDSQLVGAGGS